MLVVIPVQSIIDRNYYFTCIPCDDKRKKAVEGCYGSFIYYNTPQEQITSIVTSLIKGHFFLDGNKRTALFVYLALSKLNNLPYIEDENEQVKVFVEIASTHKKIEECVYLLFPKH